MGVFLSIFVSLREITSLGIAVIVLAGISYVLLGIYGFSIISQLQNHTIHLIYFALQIFLCGLIVYLSKGIGVSVLVLFPLVGQTVMILQPRTMIAVNAVIALMYISTLAFFSQDWTRLWNSVPWYLAGQLFLIIFLQTSLEEEKAHASNLRLLNDLAEANSNLKEYANQVEILTITRERNRIAREIHDGVGHYLTVIHMQIQAALAVMNTKPERSRETLERAAIQAKEALMEIRNSVAILREIPEDTETLEEKIGRLLKQLGDSTIETHYNQIGDLITMPAQYEHTIYRSIQEGVQNCLKHAQASHLWIELDTSDCHRVKLSIRDDGKGSQENSNGFGLTSLAERVRIQQGQFSAGNHPDGGFYLTVEVPYDR
jgi:signal transduction histidine kinase